MTGIVFNGLDLNMADPTNEGWRLQARVDGTDWGSGEAVIASVMSQLQDGDLQAITRWGNRTAIIEVRIDAITSPSPGNSLALGQKALELACRFPNQWAELLLTSDLAGAATSVVEVVAAIPEAVMDYRAEFTNLERVYRLTLRARPFVRATELTRMDAPATSGTTTVVDDGTSTTGWSQLTASGATLTNLCPNPSFEANANGWTAVTGSIARGGNSPSSGYGANMLVCTPSSATQQIVTTSSTLGGVVGGATYFFSASVMASRVNSTARSILLSVQWFSGATVLGGDTHTIAATGGSAFRRYTWDEITAPATADGVRYSIQLSATSGHLVGDWWALDAVQFAISDDTYGSNYKGEYFEGGYGATAARTFAWTGTANNSTSTCTFTPAPAMAVVGDAVKAWQYGNSRIAVRRTGAVSMTATPYMRIKGQIAMAFNGILPAPPPRVSVADNGAPVPIDAAFRLDPVTGDFDIVIRRPEGFSAIDIMANFVNADQLQPNLLVDVPMTLAIDSIIVTDNPYAGGAVQSRQIAIQGSQRTDLSLSILGLDNSAAAVGLGEMVAVYTGTRSDDGRQKFAAARSAASLSGTIDSTATSGIRNTLSSSPTTFSFPQGSIVPGSYLVMARVQFGSAATGSRITISHKANAGGNPDGATSPTYTTPVTFKASGAAWPEIPTNAWGFVPLCVTRLPWADGDVNAGNLNLSIAALDHAILLDDLFLFNIDAGQLSFVNTKNSGGSFSAVTLDAATVAAPQASAKVGASTGSTNGMLADSARWIGEQHQAEPGLLQVATITPGCTTSQISASYFARYLSHVAAEN